MRATFALVGIASSQMGRGRSEMLRIECQFVLGICVLDFALIKCREREGERRKRGRNEGGKWSHFCGTFDACVANAFTINFPCLLPAGGAKPKWSIEFCAIRRHCAAPPPPLRPLPIPCSSPYLLQHLTTPCRLLFCSSLSVGVIETFLAAARVEFSVPPQRTLSRPQSILPPSFSPLSTALLTHSQVAFCSLLSVLRVVFA